MKIAQHPDSHLIYLHGFASSAGGRKPDYLRPHRPHPSPSFTGRKMRLSQ